MKQREIRLLLTLLGLFFVAANVVAGLKLVQKKNAIAKERSRLELVKSDLEELLADRDRFREYRQWINENQPVFENREIVEQELLEAADGAEEFDIAVTGKDLLEIEELEQAIQAGIWLRTEGSLENLLKWFHELQQPAAFRVIRRLRLNPDSDDVSKMSCEFLLLRWYRTVAEPESSPSP